LDDVLGIFILVTLLVFKVILMRAVWRMAGEQGRPQGLFLLASAFAALLVYLALWNRERERKQWAELEARKVGAKEKTKPAIEIVSK
jgi:membrane protein DedA with SNARE-associated domain